MSNHVKVDDIVQVIAGDDKGKTGKVLSIDHIKQRVVVEGVNRVYKHVRPSRKNPQGGRLQVERPIHMSNVLPVSHKSNRGTRVRFEVSENGEKSRVSVDGETHNVIRKAK